MSATATPNGAEPIGTLSASGSFTGKVRHIKIASGYGTAIFYGDFLKNSEFWNSRKRHRNNVFDYCGCIYGMFLHRP